MDEQIFKQIADSWEKERENWQQYEYQLSNLIVIRKNVDKINDYLKKLDEEYLNKLYPLYLPLYILLEKKKISFSEYSDYSIKQKNGAMTDDEIKKELVAKNKINESEYITWNEIPKADKELYNADWFLNKNKDKYAQIIGDDSIRNIIDLMVETFQKTNASKSAFGAPKTIINRNNLKNIFNFFQILQQDNPDKIEELISQIRDMNKIGKEVFGFYNLTNEKVFVYNSRVDNVFKLLFDNYKDGQSLSYIEKYYSALRDEFKKIFSKNLQPAKLRSLIKENNLGLTDSSEENLSINLQIDQMIYNYDEKYLKDEKKNKKNKEEINVGKTNKTEKINHSLNTILYGPAGTGKTYYTIEKAIRIANSKFEFPSEQNTTENRKLIKDEYKKLFHEGKIVFTSFHQSLSYEDFIEGIKPELTNDNEEPEHIKYIIEPGIFRNICEAAEQKKKNISKYDFDESKIEFNKMSLGNTQKEDDDIFEFCISNNVIALGYGKDIDYSNTRNRDDIRKLLVEKYPDSNKFSWEAVDRFKNVMRIGDIVLISQGNKYIRAIGKITGEYYYEENTTIRYNHFREVEWLYADTIIPTSQILNNKNLSQQTIYQFYKKDVNINYIKSLLSFTDEEIDKENYVLIIDEINRGNVSQIFGELITLIEEDKRAGNPEALEVTLPYSKEKFSVPKNLYILGTMNTADRSVEALDTALRRRFSFEFMPPLYDLPGLDVDVAGIKLSALLKTINERITYLLDEDHQIGHSYFMAITIADSPETRVNKLREIFKNKIIPLLKEYFYNDYSKIRLILGDKFTRESSKPVFAVQDDELEKDMWQIVKIDDEFDIVAALLDTIKSISKAT